MSFVFVVCVCVRLGSALLEAYREYLEHMLLDSEDLVVVDQFTVPTHVYLPLLEEWAWVE